ncbi:MAG: hypothetical protein QOJ41_2159 [Acidobacteriaceae bacterium]|nr:hypothetical protein [Acidobacteriaceae bacterium]
MPFQPKIRVAVAPATEYELRRRLFDMLASQLEVSFEPLTPGNYEDLQGLIALNGAGEAAREASVRNVSCYEVILSQPIPFAAQSAITFTSSGAVHRAFRGKTLADSSLMNFSAVPDSCESLAKVGEQSIWAFKQQGDKEHHYVGVGIPVLEGRDFFHNHFRERRWFSMVPLLHFLRRLLGPDGWPAPEPRASFIIDDPNLHHRSYGYIDFEKLANHASAHNYHATMATVPLDAWYFDRKVVDLFQTHKKQISLMMHGVNHVADELARPYEEQDALSLLATGLRRIAALESRSGVSVARIMAAPHGAFAEFVADLMVRLSYDGACVSVGSLLRWNPEKLWPANLGFAVAQPLGSSALPVFHRIGISETDIRLNAFLGHPVLVTMHHQDCVSNFARLESMANIVNSIDSVRWMGIEKISTTNFVSKLQNGTLRIWPYSRHFIVPLSPEITEVEVSRSPYCGSFTIDLHNHRRDGAVQNIPARHRISNNTLEIFLPPNDAIDYTQVESKNVGLWPVVRRLLTEARDRTQPILSLASAR